MTSIQFSPHHRPLRVGEAIEIARALDQRLRVAGFTQSRHRTFSVVEQKAGFNQAPPGTWEGAELLLASGERMVASMDLFSLSANGMEIDVNIKNWVRTAALAGFNSNIYAHNLEREWGLSVSMRKTTFD
ncbi:hypothetical protein SH591_02825 [Sphingomonas sp. LY54]|uniref:hypothetical protein n=1 Tax=Sphingomonas sp. LY54 TaxID=3095343 RepID=UPI002D775A9B|nr:hypothetical protein [Sphingomonas sp. LY54]WRP29133.1 hypothetical protein SH591_02825 [Sphingomonas sp. LY54]